MADVRNLMMLRGTRGRSGHLVFGVGLVLMGYALLVIALAEQAQRAAAATLRAAAVESIASAQAAALHEPTAATTETPAPSVPIPAASTAPAASVAPVAADADADARFFKFSPGGAVMARDEVQRLLALGKVIGHRPNVKVSIEGFGDLAGSEPLMVGIAKHRAKVAQTLLAKAGVPEDRVILTFVDMGSDTRLARSIRITTTPPLSEIEKP